MPFISKNFDVGSIFVYSLRSELLFPLGVSYIITFISLFVNRYVKIFTDVISVIIPPDKQNAFPRRQPEKAPETILKHIAPLIDKNAR